mgnify:CR=1 FL=1
MADAGETAQGDRQREAKAVREAWIGTVVAVLVGALVALAGSQGSASIAGMPAFALAAGLAYLINWIVFVPSFLARTEHYFDLTGSLTYVTVALGTAWFVGADARGWLVAGLVTLWAGRLGSFLFLRVKQDGRDGRFDELKASFPRFLMTWTLQGLWVTLTLAAGMAAITTTERAPLGVLAWTGVAVWAFGFLVEAVADAQKRAFKRRDDREKDFITDGLWAWSRHPNYFGEIVLWCGIALIAAEVLRGWQWVTMISPLFVYLLLTRISGVPLLEARARRRWGEDPEYQAYRDRVPVLWPRPPKAG